MREPIRPKAMLGVRNGFIHEVISFVKIKSGSYNIETYKRYCIYIIDKEKIPATTDIFKEQQ